MPALTKNSVLLNGPNTARISGCPDARLRVPELLASKIELTLADRGRRAIRRSSAANCVQCAVLLGVDPDAAFLDQVGADVRQELPLDGVGQRDLDVVVARLDAERGLHAARPPSDPLNVRATLAPIEHAVVELVELIAVGRVRQEEREIVEQVERALDHVGIGLPVSGIVASGAQRPENEKRLVLPPSVGSSAP